MRVMGRNGMSKQEVGERSESVLAKRTKKSMVRLGSCNTGCE